MKKRVGGWKLRKQSQQSDMLGYPLAVCVSVEGPLGRISIEKRGITRSQVKAFALGVEKVMTQAGLVQVFKRPGTRRKKRP